MEKLDSFKLLSWPFEGYKFVSDLIDFEGPLLVHYQKSERNALFYWVEGDNKFNRWLCFNVTVLELYNYLNRNISLLGLIESKYDEIFFTVDIDELIQYQNFQGIRGFDIPDKYLPDLESYYLDEVNSIYKTLFYDLNTKNHYLQHLRSHALSLKIKPPKNDVYGGTLSANNIVDFLRQFEQSYKAYAGYRYYNNNKEKITNPDKLLQNSCRR